jgi:hypothetical protein
MAFDHMPPFDPKIDHTKIDVAEFAVELNALSVLMRAVLSTVASQIELSTGGGRTWINTVSEACQNTVEHATITGLSPEDADDFKRKTMERINKMLKPIRFKNEPAPPKN